jgi:hypothetical protein
MLAFLLAGIQSELARVVESERGPVECILLAGRPRERFLARDPITITLLASASGRFETLSMVAWRSSAAAVAHAPSEW